MAYCHKREDLSRLQRSEELRGALKSSGRNLGDLTLDVGCGKGYVFNLLNKLGRQAVGLDIKPGFVRGMVQRGLHGVIADGRELPFRSSTFDKVMCFEVVEHVNSPEHVFKEIHRVLREGGLSILRAPIASPINVMVDLIRGEKTRVSEMSLTALLLVLRKYSNRLHYKPVLVLPIPQLLFGKYFWFETDFLANYM